MESTMDDNDFIKKTLKSLQNQIDTLTTSFRYIINDNNDIIPQLRHYQSYTLPFLVSSRELTMEKQLVKEFRDRPSDMHCISEAQRCLETHAPKLVVGTLYWNPNNYPPPATNLSCNTRFVMQQNTCFKYDHSGIWRKIVCDVLPEPWTGHEHEVLVVVGLGGAIIAVDWNIGKIPENYQQSAVLLLRH